MTTTLEDIRHAQQKLTDMITTLAKQPPVIHTLGATLPDMTEGERYVGSIISADGAIRHHIILLPGDNDATSWQKQMDWAASIGGVLPDRVEGALLFATMKDEFKPEWYWTREQHASNESYAWLQYFDNGCQYYGHKDSLSRARAVRRVAI